MYKWGKGRTAGRVGSDFLSVIAGRVGSGQRFAGSSRVQESDPCTTLIQLSTVTIKLIFHILRFILNFTYSFIFFENSLN